MLDALVNLAGDAEFSEKLPPTGFYNYSQPIRWTVQISENGARLEESDVNSPRPYTGRAGRNFAPHPFADEASYALGVSRIDDKEIDTDAAAKHATFIDLMKKVEEDEELAGDLRQAARAILKVLSENGVGKDSRLTQISAKDWVAFALPDENGIFRRIFEWPSAKQFWIQEVKERTAATDSKGNLVVGECSICGQQKPLVSRIPVGVKLISKPGPLHSLNKNAFVSGRSSIKGHANICFECGDTASRTFNALASDKQHRRIIVMDKSAGGSVKLDSLRNQVALFWIEKGGVALPEADFDVFSALGDLMKPVAASDDEDLEEGGEEKLKAKKGKTAVTDAPKPQARLSQLANFLNIQHRAAEHLTNIDGAKFALAVFSPNVGRTALREWLYKDLDKVIPHARLYLNATKINDAWGKSGEPQSINALMEALNSKNANLTRDLIRTAYEGVLPPQEMLVLAVQHFRTLMVKGKQDKQLDEWQRQRHLHALATALKFSLFYCHIRDLEGGQTYMNGLETGTLANDSAYLCGRMLAVLEEAQQVYTYRQYKKRLKTTGVQRSFGSASATPFVVLTNLLKLATKAHMPKAGKYLNTELEKLVAQIAAQGGYPNSLDIAGQGRLGLGYWHQRGEIRSHWTPDEQKADENAEQDDTDGGNL